MNWEPLILTFKLAVLTTFILLVVALPLARWLSTTKAKIKPVIETLVSMPLVLPPTVLGFYFLMAFSPNNFFGNWLNEWLGVKLVFSFAGLTVASVLYSL
ncbi:MAG: molybdate ABC transporter permease subunit, partial [Bacteroidota bacterium]|nr:molybdate ABC transporter permease subunit [Bacteroidota bacterium]